MRVMKSARGWSHRGSADGERGATLILIALVITALFVITALVVDLSFVRQNRQADKSATDFAAAAGIRALDDLSGEIRVWKGICAARDFVVANNDELSSLTPADENWLAVPTDPCTSPPSTACAGPATWGTYRGIADGGRIRVTIQNGYKLPDPDFPEDTSEYGGDTADPCEQLAVIIREHEDEFFGGVVGSTGHITKIRSVGRLNRDPGAPAPAALVLLEQTGCKAIEIQGASNASVTVAGVGSTPGMIHADSDGSTCSDDYIFSVGANSVTSPKIIAGSATAANAAGSIEAGALTAYALHAGAAAANPGATYDPDTTPRKVCARRDPTAFPDDCKAMPPDVTGALPSGNDRVTRAAADGRYLGALNTLLDSIDTWTDSNPPPATGPDAWRIVTNCDNPAPLLVEPRIFINCKGGAWNAKGFSFADTVRHIVVDGHLVLEGGSLVMGSPDTVYIRGKAGEAGIRTAGSAAQLSINTGAATPAIDCDSRQSHLFNNGLLQTARTKVVVGTGGLETAGNDGQLRLCATTLFLVDNTHTSTSFDTADGPCELKSAMYRAPYANGCQGRITVKGSASVDWSAPNVTEGDPAPHFNKFEDLAFWTETHLGNTVEGSGLVELAGIFFTPNADPFRIAGSEEAGIPKFDLKDAQFVTRRLQVSGGGNLVLAPQPKNAIQIPQLGGFALVR